MAQNRNGSEPLVVCGKKGEKDMRGMEMWRKSNRFYERNVSRQSDIYCELELLVVGLV